jgi:tRNA(Ile)-lysidine synthetase-like protein
VILNFWKENPQFWISVANKKLADQEIYDKFYEYNYTKDDWIGQVIYLDQFQRHFQRVKHLVSITEEFILQCRHNAIQIVQQHFSKISKLSEEELVFILFPFKHLHQYDFIFQTIHEIWLPCDSKIIDFKVLHRFYIDTCRKYFTLDRIKISESLNPLPFDAKEICEYYPSNFLIGYKQDIPKSIKKLLTPFLDKHVVISLSGGVDSMVLLRLCKLLEIKVIAVHILYNNRKTSHEEFNFLTEYCHALQVDLYYYSIPWLRREQVERSFYESLTRDIRFMVYRSLGFELPNVFLGHIQEDVVENIFTNFAKGQHYHHLAKFSELEKQQGVTVSRPFLTVPKQEILELSRLLGVPFLKNTTPEWSNRGKFRNQFYPVLVKQYGPQVDKTLLQSAKILEEQSQLLEKFVYQPILDTFCNNSLQISKDILTNLTTVAWLFMFEKICYTYLKIPKPSLSSIQNFVEKIKRKRKRSGVIEMSKYLRVEIKELVIYFHLNKFSGSTIDTHRIE